MSSTELDPEQVEKLTEIGTHLKAVRQQQGQSLDEIASKTLIHRRMLQAIEEGTLAQLPEPIYIKGFIRRFGDALGLNGPQLAESFPIRPVELLIGTHTGLRQASTPLRPIHLYVFYVLLLLAAVSGLSYLVNQSARTYSNSPSRTISSPTGPSPASTPPSTPVASPSTKPSPSPQPQAPIAVALRIDQDSWLQVTVDGQPKYEGVLPTGSRQTYTGQNKIEIAAGNAGGVWVSINNQPEKRLGQPGVVEELVIDTKSGQSRAERPER